MRVAGEAVGYEPSNPSSTELHPVGLSFVMFACLSFNGVTAFFFLKNYGFVAILISVVVTCIAIATLCLNSASIEITGLVFFLRHLGACMRGPDTKPLTHREM